jgi:hypothetical protein
VALPRYHLLASAGLGAVMLTATGSKKAALAPFVSGFLIDVDHLGDYALTRIGVRHKIVLALHGWEYVPLWFLVDRLLGLRGGAVLGYLLHLSIDQWWNEKRSWLAYFITWRARRGFRADQLGPVDADKRHKWREASPLGLLRWL